MNEEEYKYSGRTNHKENTTINVKGVVFGAKKIVLIAGPCAIESNEQIEKTFSEIKNVDVYRGGAYKPRTSPYAFLGLKKDGIEIIKKAAKNKPFVTEITKIEDIPYFEENVDIIQVGARDMQNFELLTALGKVHKPIILKRGFGNTIDELLLASEYILKEGNKEVILCERGIRTFETAERFTLDIGAISIIKKASHLPLIVDPSHAAGNKDYVESLTLAAIAAGADGVMVEVHTCPEQALSDKEQALTPKEYNSMVEKINKVAEAIGRSV